MQPLVYGTFIGEVSFLRLKPEALAQTIKDNLMARFYQRTASRI
jgi:hypothetical protein